MICMDLAQLMKKYEQAQTKEDQYIRKMLENIAELCGVCEETEYYYADLITRNFCRIIAMTEKQHEKKLAQMSKVCSCSEHTERYHNGADLVCAFYDYYKEEKQVSYREIGDALASGRRDLVNPTMKDYAARIYTFAGKRYLGQMFTAEELGGMDPVLFVYENIEQILATFKTRDEQGEIVKQRVNIRSALRKLNEFKQNTQF